MHNELLQSDAVLNQKLFFNSSLFTMDNYLLETIIFSEFTSRTFYRFNFDVDKYYLQVNETVIITNLE